MRLFEWIRRLRAPRRPIRDRIRGEMDLVFRRTGHPAGLVVVGYALREKLVGECGPAVFWTIIARGEYSVTDVHVGQYLDAPIEFVNWTEDFVVLPRGWGRQFFRGRGIG